MDVNSLSEEKLKEVLKDKNLENGLIVICNESFDKQEVIDDLKNISGQDMKHIQRMNACDIFYLDKFLVN